MSFFTLQLVKSLISSFNFAEISFYAAYSREFLSVIYFSSSIYESYSYNLRYNFFNSKFASSIYLSFLAISSL